MGSIRLDAVASRCVRCCQVFRDRHRLLGSYRADDLVYARDAHEVGLFGEKVRPYWIHVDCQDPTLYQWNMRPDVTYCIRCRKAVQTHDYVQPVFGVLDGKAVNPADPTDVGVLLSDRIYFIHADCRDSGLKGTSPIIRP